MQKLHLIVFSFIFFPPFISQGQETVDSVNKRSTLGTLQDLLFGKKGFGPIASYSSRDHIHVGLRYGIVKPAAEGVRTPQTHLFSVRYSISEKTFSYEYEAAFQELIGGWDLELGGGYDHMRWHNFYGIGNESVLRTDDRDYHRVRAREIDGYILLSRQAGNHHFRIGPVYRSVKLLNDPGRFHTEYTPELLHFRRDHFIGGTVQYQYKKINDPLLPSKGIIFETQGQFVKNMKADSSVLNFGGELNAFAPLGPFVFSLKSGAASLTGEPEFYQLNRIGGSQTMRGYRRWRFYGKSVFYNQAELQFIRNVELGKLKGRAGLIALYDIGRAWHPGLPSDQWHHAYGAGVMIAPMNKVSVAVFYAISPEENDISLRFSTGL